MRGVRRLTEEKSKDRIGGGCWHHGNIPSLRNALLGVEGQYPNPWASDVFNLILLTEFGGERAVSVTQIIQPF